MDLGEITGYADLRKLVSAEAYTEVSNFLAWHNQQRQTAPLELGAAVVTALAMARRPIDRMFYRSIKTFFADREDSPPRDLNDCRRQADRLLEYLFPHDYHPDSE